MKAIKAAMGRPLPHTAEIFACDNSGARILRIISVVGHKTKRGRIDAGGIGDKIMASVVDGKPEMRKQVVMAVIARQKKEFRRLDGTRMRFEDNAAIVIKDELGNPKGTMVKGPVAREVCDRWPNVAKIISILV